MMNPNAPRDPNTGDLLDAGQIAALHEIADLRAEGDDDLPLAPEGE